jgi:hypothetical protein
MQSNKTAFMEFTFQNRIVFYQDAIKKILWKFINTNNEIKDIPVLFCLLDLLSLHFFFEQPTE